MAAEHGELWTDGGVVKPEENVGCWKKKRTRREVREKRGEGRREKGAAKREGRGREGSMPVFSRTSASVAWLILSISITNQRKTK